MKNLENNTYHDMKVGKTSTFTFPMSERERTNLRLPEGTVNGIFSYNGKDTVWVNLEPENEYSKPAFKNEQEAWDEYYKEEYEKGTKDRIVVPENVLLS